MCKEKRAVLMWIRRDDFPAFQPFIDLPSKVDYEDYYKVIARPVSLKTLKKGVRGVKGKNAATGKSLYETWTAFEKEASFIWENAFKYNEDGSDISVLALEFKVRQEEVTILSCYALLITSRLSSQS